MKVLVLSDLHLEFAPFEPVPDLEFDVVILAGDIHSPAKRAVQWAADRFRGKPVIYLLGNHECYVNWSGRIENQAFDPGLVIDVQALAGGGDS